MTEDLPFLLRRIQQARVYDVAHETPLQAAPALSARLGREVMLKREDTQPVFSFKLRGAYNKMACLSKAQRRQGVIAASAGNHAQGVALAAAKLGISATIVMPVTAPRVKVDAVRRLGGDFVEVHLQGESYSDAQAVADALATQQGLNFIHPFDDLDVIAGQGTVGQELLAQTAENAPLDVIFVPVGGGGLLAGIAAYVKAVQPATRVIGVQAADSDAMARSVAEGQRITLPQVGLFADGTAVKTVGRLNFSICQRYADGYLRVDTDAICAAIRDIYAETRCVLEPAGALALAGLKQYVANGGEGQRLAAICSGANLNFDQLRFIAERAELGERGEAIFVVSLTEQHGSLRRFCRLLEGLAITEFNYRAADPAQAQVFVGVQTPFDEREALAARFRAAGYPTLDLGDDELAKSHLRHLVGGRTDTHSNERLYRFTFPERPGALSRFLEQMQLQWNISLFHYRNHGADYGRVLIGLEVPSAEYAIFTDFLEQIGYLWVEESDNRAYHTLLRMPD